MTILGLGVDIVHLPRIAALISRRSADRFACRVLSPTEYGQWKQITRSAAPAEQIRFLGVRWCVKEASYKALYPLVKPTWKELTYHPLSNGQKPWLQFHPNNANNFEKVGQVHVSISHDGDYIYSSVLIEAPAST
ncbi:4'-phosphopantetheinyl transferase [Crepidotus variabilis]|uniref:4'-phosphopantetheinyl transferase n=1 Tax=Crepidotus variabilis TaxID=179855 RepID=A0A9P6ETG3_9AGAR|nr:4'-phosphopantetheinyl transferase [Crepidotus variabilis]